VTDDMACVEADSSVSRAFVFYITC